jgi:hypothetical protein
MPLLDEELGYHPHHHLVQARKVRSSYGWDGEQGPFVENVGKRTYVNVANIDRSDYVSNALRNKIDIRKTAGVDAEELIRRMDALRRCIRVLPPTGDWVSNTKLWLVSAEKIADWDTDPRRATPLLLRAGYFYLFADCTNDQEHTSDLARDRVLVKQLFECQISDDVVAVKQKAGGWKVIPIASLSVRRN